MIGKHRPIQAPAYASGEVLRTQVRRTPFSGACNKPFVSAPWLSTLCALVLLLFGQTSDAQRLSYSSGQNVSPAYEGWEEDVDGSRYFLFGYMNRNW
ncbi:MAG TPA: hypothetical protein DIU48_14760, partial [Acidobacteria bacterium]|nr:hypothetical protein [Acidobacteriota bacterium]